MSEHLKRDRLNAEVAFTANNTYVDDVEGKGRCVFSARYFEPGDVILINHVLPYNFLPDEHELLDHSMSWTDDKDCIALGNINLLSHAVETNCEIVDWYDLKVKVLKAKKIIERGDELTINYACPLWFEVK